MDQLTSGRSELGGPANQWTRGTSWPVDKVNQVDQLTCGRSEPARDSSERLSVEFSSLVTKVAVSLINTATIGHNWSGENETNKHFYIMYYCEVHCLACFSGKREIHSGTFPWRVPLCPLPRLMKSTSNVVTSPWADSQTVCYISGAASGLSLLL